MNLITIENEYGYIIKIEDKENLLNESIIKGLQSYKFEVYFNDLDCYYWIYDFKINSIWFELTHIDMNKCIIELNAYI